MSYVDRYIEMYKAKNRRFEVIDGQLFTRKDRWVMPTGPVAQPYELSPEQCHHLLKKLGGLWVQWTDGFGEHAKHSEWHAMICRQHVPVTEIADKKRRKKMRRALKECEVHKVEPQEIAKNGYETFCEALLHYKNSSINIPSYENFYNRVLSDAPFSDIRHHWASYIDGKMVAFAQTLIYDHVEVDYTLSKLHPQYRKYNVGYAMRYHMNDYYLAKNNFQYVNSGFRSISHDTAIQDFLVREFDYNRDPSGLHVFYRRPLTTCLRLASPFRKFITPAIPKLKPLFELHRMRNRQ